MSLQIQAHHGKERVVSSQGGLASQHSQPGCVQRAKGPTDGLTGVSYHPTNPKHGGRLSPFTSIIAGKNSQHLTIERLTTVAYVLGICEPSVRADKLLLLHMAIYDYDDPHLCQVDGVDCRLSSFRSESVV